MKDSSITKLCVGVVVSWAICWTVIQIIVLFLNLGGEK
jgi:hypothetical protein